MPDIWLSCRDIEFITGFGYATVCQAVAAIRHDGHLEERMSPQHGNRRECRACCLNALRARYDAKHAGHNVIDTTRLTRDGVAFRRCLTCLLPRRPAEPDDAAVIRAVAGDPPPRLRPAERRAAVLQLRAALPVPVIAEVVHCSERTVWRHLAAARTAA